jgi:hypothetical protein
MNLEGKQIETIKEFDLLPVGCVGTIMGSYYEYGKEYVWVNWHDFEGKEIYTLEQLEDTTDVLN